MRGVVRSRVSLRLNERVHKELFAGIDAARCEAKFRFLDGRAVRSRKLARGKRTRRLFRQSVVHRGLSSEERTIQKQAMPCGTANMRSTADTCTVINAAVIAPRLIGERALVADTIDENGTL